MYTCAAASVHPTPCAPVAAELSLGRMRARGFISLAMLRRCGTPRHHYKYYTYNMYVCMPCIDACMYACVHPQIYCRPQVPRLQTRAQHHDAVRRSRRRPNRALPYRVRSRTYYSIPLLLFRHSTPRTRMCTRTRNRQPHPYPAQLLAACVIQEAAHGKRHGHGTAHRKPLYPCAPTSASRWNA